MKTRRILICLTILSLLLNSCAMGLLKVKYLEDYNISQLRDISYTPSEVNSVVNKIRTLREKLKGYSNQLDEKDYDELIKELTPIIEEYKKYTAINVTNKDKGIIIIPPKTKLTLTLDTYCLSPHHAAPSDDEPYVLVNETPDIPLYNEIMRYTNTKERVSRSLKQNLLWNLKNEVKFEDLPLEQQSLLLEVDSSAYLKVNSYLKELVKKEVGKLLDKYLSEVGKAKDVIDIIKGKVYTYQDYAQRVENLKSKYKKPSNDNLIKSEGYEVSTIVKANGYSIATVIFINITDTPQEINSYFKPLRKDIQPLGFDLPDPDELLGGLKQGFGELLADVISEIFKRRYGMDLKQGDRLSIENNPEKLIGLLIAFRDREKANSRTSQEFGSSGLNDITDAFRHAYWNALMARDLGDSFASEIANNHELNEKKPDENTMDLWNNKIGRDTGNRLKEQGITDDDSIATEILKNKDKLKTLK